jgi:hypothetical protein
MWLARGWLLVRRTSPQTCGASQRESEFSGELDPDRASLTGRAQSHTVDYSRYYVDDRKYFTLSNFYEQIGKPWRQRAMPMVHEPNPHAIEVYRRWKELNV